jgi:hypothetical protein
MREQSRLEEEKRREFWGGGAEDDTRDEHGRTLAEALVDPDVSTGAQSGTRPEDVEGRFEAIRDLPKHQQELAQIVAKNPDLRDALKPHRANPLEASRVLMSHPASKALWDRAVRDQIAQGGKKYHAPLARRLNRILKSEGEFMPAHPATDPKYKGYSAPVRFLSDLGWNAFNPIDAGELFLYGKGYKDKIERGQRAAKGDLWRQLSEAI